MADLLARVEHQVTTRRLLRPRQKVLVAASGGLDSMVLLHSLRALAPKFRWQISIAHFNHHLRGAASRADERLVRNYAKIHQLPFYFGEARVKKLADETGTSLEMAARKVRHQFLADTARTHKISTIAVAHHADDQVELFFLRLFRGAGGEGVAGMKWQTTSPVDSRLKLVRPLLDLNKPEIHDFAQQHNILFRKDATNDSTKIPRNRIRHQLLPLLKRNFQAELNKTVLRFMEIAGAEAEVSTQLAKQWLANNQSGFNRLPVAVQRRIIQLQLNELQIAADFDRIERLRLSIGVPVSVSSNLSLICDEQGRITQKKPDLLLFNDRQLSFPLTGHKGHKIFENTKIIWKLIRANGSIVLKKSTAMEFFDAEKVGKTIYLRHWQAGDRFQPIGLKTPVKLQDLFTNAKIPQADRHQKIVAAGAEGRIFWVEGLRLGELYKITPQTCWILNWRWDRISLKWHR